jgi:uncharacterized protein YukE
MNTEEEEYKQIEQEWEKAMQDIQDALNAIGQEFKKISEICNDGK